jgi:ribosomal protein S4
VRPRRGPTEDHATQLNKWAKLPQALDKDAKLRRKEIDGEEQEELPPVGSLMFSEVERRIDVVIFRACLAHSVYDARRMVVHGQVLLNGKKVHHRVVFRTPSTNTPVASKRERPPRTRGHGFCRSEGHIFPPPEDSKCGEVFRRAGHGRAQK